MTLTESRSHRSDLLDEQVGHEPVSLLVRVHAVEQQVVHRLPVALVARLVLRIHVDQFTFFDAASWRAASA